MKPHTVSQTQSGTQGKARAAPGSQVTDQHLTRSSIRRPSHRPSLPVTPRGGSHPHTATCRRVSHSQPHCSHPQISVTSVHKHLQTGRTRTVTPARGREGHTHTHSHPRRDHTISCIVTPRQGSHPHIQSPQAGGHTHVTPDGCHARTQSLHSHPRQGSHRAVTAGPG